MHAGNELETFDNYPQLSALLLDSQLEQSARISGLNLTMGCGTTLDAPGLGETFAATGDRYYSITLKNLRVLARNTSPLTTSRAEYTKRITLSHWNQISHWTTALGIDSDACINVRAIEYHANMVR